MIAVNQEERSSPSEPAPSLRLTGSFDDSGVQNDRGRAGYPVLPSRNFRLGLEGLDGGMMSGPAAPLAESTPHLRLVDPTFEPHEVKVRTFQLPHFGWWGEVQSLVGLQRGNRPRTLRQLRSEDAPILKTKAFREPVSDPESHRLRSDRLRRILESESATPVARGLYLYRYLLPVPNLPTALEGLTILHRTDSHVDHRSEKSIRRLEAFARHFEASGEQIDITFDTGDIINNTARDLHRRAIAAFDAIAPNSIRLWVDGNHDPYDTSLEYVRRAMSSIGFQDVSKGYARIVVDGAPLNVFGVQDFLEGRPRTVHVPHHMEGETNFLLAHNLDSVRANCSRCFTAIFSGHTHGGEMDAIVVNGMHFMKLFGYSQDINRHYSGWDMLTDTTAAFVGPGLARHWFHMNTQKPGMALIHLTNASVNL